MLVLGRVLSLDGRHSSATSISELITTKATSQKGIWGYIEIRRPRSAGRAPGKPSVPFLGTFRESGELLCKKRVLVLPQHSSKVRT